MNGNILGCYQKYFYSFGTPLLTTLLSTSSVAEGSDKNFDHNNQYPTSYSQDISTIDPFTLKYVNRKSGDAVPQLGARKKILINKDDVGKLIYKTIKNPRKVASQAAAGAAMVGLDYLEMAKPLKEGVKYLKKKTSFEFGDCGQVRFSGKLKARTCLMDNSNIELNSNYKMDKVTVDFNWDL